MGHDVLQEAATALQDDWGLRLSHVVIEEELLQLLADRIVQVLERGPETFFQLMYRLDIPEKKLNAVLNSDNAAMQIARLVYDRQLQKIQSRQQNRTQKKDDDPELRW